jgi:hypothetical protein
MTLPRFVFAQALGAEEERDHQGEEAEAQKARRAKAGTCWTTGTSRTGGRQHLVFRELPPETDRQVARR